MSSTVCAAASGSRTSVAKIAGVDTPEQGQTGAANPYRDLMPRPPRTPWAWTVATVFGTGFLKPGPGTWGSVVAVLLWLGYRWLVDPSPPALRAATLLAALLALVTGIPAAGIVERESGQGEPGHVVIDEVAGEWIALLAFCGYGHADWQHALLALLLFRIFDILKPPPVRQLEALHGGIGILMDDAAAGIYALLVGALIGHWW